MWLHVTNQRFTHSHSLSKALLEPATLENNRFPSLNHRCNNARLQLGWLLKQWDNHLLRVLCECNLVCADIDISLSVIYSFYFSFLHKNSRLRWFFSAFKAADSPVAYLFSCLVLSASDRHVFASTSHNAIIHRFVMHVMYLSLFE